MMKKSLLLTHFAHLFLVDFFVHPPVVHRQSKLVGILFAAGGADHSLGRLGLRVLRSAANRLMSSQLRVGRELSVALVTLETLLS